MTTNNDPSNPNKAALLNQRSAVILLLGVLAGIGAAVLAALTHTAWPLTITAGGGTTAMGILFFNQIID
ncbi:hypothetical protein [Streptomyces sp. NPDC005046]